jgi:hypothetical protein
MTSDKRYIAVLYVDKVKNNYTPIEDVSYIYINEDDYKKELFDIYLDGVIVDDFSIDVDVFKFAIERVGDRDYEE